jgi:hypothetical protein
MNINAVNTLYGYPAAVVVFQDHTGYIMTRYAISMRYYGIAGTECDTVTEIPDDIAAVFCLRGKPYLKRAASFQRSIAEATGRPFDLNMPAE